MRDLVILGSTGSIGVQALEIVAANPGVFNVVAISAYGSNPAAIIEQARTYKVQVIGVVINAEVIREALPGVAVIDGATAASEIAATYLRLYRSATLPLTNTNNAIGPNSASPSQPISSDRPVMS